MIHTHSSAFISFTLFLLLFTSLTLLSFILRMLPNAMILPALVKEQKGGALNPPIIRSFDPFLELFRYNCIVYFLRKKYIFW